MRQRGYRTIRYSNQEVLADPEGLVNALLVELYADLGAFDLALKRPLVLRNRPVSKRQQQKV